METIALRLRKYLEFKDVKRKDFAEEVDIPYASLNHILNNNRNMSSEILEKIFNYFPEMNTRWFITGKGPMEYTSSSYYLDPEKESNKVSEPFEVSEEETERLLNLFIKNTDVKKAVQKMIQKELYKEI